jgi:hypothetical protein
MSIAPAERAITAYMGKHAEVRYLRYEPGDGWVYEVVVSPLPGRVLGGDVETHALVTVFGPGGPRAHAFEREGPLSVYYVREKLLQRDWSDMVSRHTAEAIGQALGREVIP